MAKQNAADQPFKVRWYVLRPATAAGQQDNVTRLPTNSQGWAMIRNDGQCYKYMFGSAEFDETKFELRVAGKPVPKVERKPLELLLALLRHDGEVVSREELGQQLWPGTHDVRQLMDNAVSKLRHALGDKLLIVTLPRIGFRLALKPRRTPLGVGHGALTGAQLRAAIQNANSTLNDVEEAIRTGGLAVESAVRAGGPLSELALTQQSEI